MTLSDPSPPDTANAGARWRPGVRMFVVGLLVLAMVPLLAIEYAVSRAAQQELVRRTQVDLGGVAQLVAVGQEQLVEGVAQFMMAISKSPPVLQNDLEACLSYFQRLQASEPGFANIGVISPQGELVCYAVVRPEGRFLGDRSYFKRAVATGQLSAGEYIVGRTSGKKAVNFGLPVFGPTGELKSVVYASIDLARLDQRMRAGQLPQQLRIRVTDGEGTVLASSHEPYSAVGQALADRVLWEAIRRGASGRIDAPGEGDGQLRTLRSVMVGGRPAFYVAVSAASDDLLAPLLHSLYLHLAATVLVTLLSAGLIWLMGDRFVSRPLRQTLDGLQRVARANYELPRLRRTPALREFFELRLALTRLGETLDRRRTERDQALAALREREVQYRELFEANPHVMWVFDVATLGFLAVNQAAVQAYGYSETEFLGMTLLDLRDPQHHAKVRQAMAEAREQDQSLADIGRYWEHRTRSGEVRHVEVSSQRIVFAGKAARLTMVTDVTQRMASEARIRELNEQLERRVAERTRDLELSNRELEAFAYTVAHDLRAPLRAINMYTQLLSEAALEAGLVQASGHADRITQSTRNMGQLISDLLDLSRVSRAELMPMPLDLSLLCHEIVRDLRAQQPGREVEVSVAEGLHCQGDPALLRQLMTNLLGNAWKFTGQTPHPRIEVGLQAAVQGQEAVFFVRDNGAGFDMRYAGQLFKPFQRLHGASVFPGTGIGLATVQRILTRHGGRIWAESAVGNGACFYFTLADRTSA